MDSKPDTVRQVALAASAALLSAAGFYFGTGLRPIWPITWFAAVPVLLVATRLSAGAACGAGFLAWAIGGLNMWHYLRNLLHIPVAICMAILLPPALVFALDVLLFRGLLRRGAVWRAVLAFPAAWVVWEYGLSLSAPHGTFGSLAYSQMDCLAVLQLASLTGVWGIGFCIFMFSASIAARKGAPAAAAVLLLALVFGFGWRRLNEPLAPAPRVRAALVASDLPGNLIAEDRSGALRLLGAYSEQAEALAARGAQVIVMPEKIAVLLDTYRDSADAILQSAANRSRATIVVGVIDVAGQARWNEGRIYSPGRAAPATYAKQHMLPPFESNLTPGITRTEWMQPSGRWGVTICKDMDFPLLSRQYGGDGTALLLVPAWDFTADGWLHGRMAILRGVEDGFSIARAPKQGILTLSDDRGRVLAERNTGAAPFSSLVGSIPVRHDDTFYARFGDWFAWLSVPAMLLCLYAVLRPERRR